MALGLMLVMKPSNCQDTPPLSDGQPRKIEAPNPSEKGTWPVRNTTMWLMDRASSRLKKYSLTPACWTLVFTCR